MSAAMRGRKHGPETIAKLKAVFNDPEFQQRRLATLAKNQAQSGDFLKPEQITAILADYRQRDAYAVADDWLISPQHVWKLAQKHGVRKRA